MREKLFGTDGIRGLATEEPFTRKYVTILADSIGNLIKKKRNKSLLIGKDTRQSSNSIEKTLTNRFFENGIKVHLAGVMSTPAISFLTQKFSCDLGIVISASHNSYEFNGLKFFNKYGEKLSDLEESFIEKQYFYIRSRVSNYLPLKERRLDNSSMKKGKIIKINKPSHIYKKKIFSYFQKVNYSLNNPKIVVDCANGSTYKLVKNIFSNLKTKLIIINNKPNGKNINYKCGSLYPKNMINVVKKRSADFGISFDGDGDRIICCDEKGKVIDGDKILACLAKYQKKFLVIRNGIVGTLMSNMGLENFLNGMGINFYRSNVGDKHVYDLMNKKKCNIGGEQSGHIILKDIIPCGDGILIALILFSIIKGLKKKTSEIFNLYKSYSQIQKNIKLKDSNNPQSKEINKLTKLYNNKISNNTRVLIRFSGTEPYIRLLVEGEEISKIKVLANKLQNKIETVI